MKVVNIDSTDVIKVRAIVNSRKDRDWCNPLHYDDVEVVLRTYLKLMTGNKGSKLCIIN